MKKTMTNYLLGSLAFLSILIVSSCGGDDPIPVPEAKFSYTVDGKTLTVTNESIDGESYLWDFADGTTSTEESPAAHTYTGNGSYIVKLTVTNASGEDDTQSVVEIINITIDGVFDEWADVPAITNTIVDGETMTTVKIENLGNTKLYIYVEGTSELTPLTQIQLNTDNDNTTGAFINWIYFEDGADILIEGSLPKETDVQYGSIYPCSPCDNSTPGDWNWGAAVNEVIDSFMEASELTTVSGGVAFEMAIDLTALGVPIDSEAIGVAVLDVIIETWGPVSAIPARYNENTNPTGTLYTYTFK